MFKKLALAALIGSISVSTGAIAQTTDWSDVAGGEESNSTTQTSSGSAQPDPWATDSETVQAPAPAPAKQAQAEPACGEDDLRYSQIVPILKSIQAGDEVEPLQTSFSTFVGLNSKIREILGDNIFISSPDCSEQFVFDGVLTGKVSVPFAVQWNVINDALRVGDKDLLQFLLENTKAASTSAHTLISMAQYAPLEGQQLERFYAVVEPNKTNGEEPTPPLMLDIYLQLGGTVNQAERGTMAYIGENDFYDDPGLYSISLEQGKGEIINFVAGQEVSGKVASLLNGAGLKTSVLHHKTAQKSAEETK
ncbi:hypothetical protein KG088_17730 [Halomonas sp. TRM85114]|uniref:hypothetical protein n=1 Tax=Halomonas jincaotanensis TaxID=2810616 RepID=UPI001BD4EE14|nr:hypothetical protein [Halomonas jincaotanensis]MBS9405448.1 hypothetical protein [Halomonas jincaotanensis]